MEDTIVHIRLPCEPESVTSARQAVVDAMVDDGRVDFVADIVLVVSELVANAVSFTTGGCGLQVSRLGERVLVEVDDCDDVNPVRRAETDRLPGHGLGVVQDLADRWGIERLPVGKCVWAEISDPVTRAATGESSQRTAPDAAISSASAAGTSGLGR